VKNRLVALVLCFAALVILPGCASILEGDVSDITAHEKPAATTAESVIEASTYDELKARILEFVKARIENGLIHVSSYKGDIYQDVDSACAEIANKDPYGAYAVISLMGIPTRVVSYFEVDIRIDYNKNVTKKQLDGIITVATQRSLRSTLQDKLTSYTPSLAVLTKSIPLTEADVDAMVQQIYYENPMYIVMMPIPTVEFFPELGPDRICEFTFGYSRYESPTLKVMAEALEKTARRVAESVTGGNDDGAILLSLCKTLMDSTEYDTAVAQSGDYSTQNIAATAYGALINGSAIGEGYAMAYKALCDELDLECDVVVGKLDGKTHAWNIIALDGDYYHVDASMCDVDGLETAFMKNDAEMKEHYSWDRLKYNACNGPAYEIPVEAIEEVEPSPSPTT
jgi:hypothetical protein